MKAVTYLSAGVLALVFGFLIVPGGTHAETANSPVTGPTGIINVLAVDDIVSIGCMNGSYEIMLLDDASVRNFQTMNAAIESAEIENKRSDDDELSSRKHYRPSPWKVVIVGKDYVRLEPLAHLPGSEKVTWIAIAEGSIRHIKSMK